MDMVTDVAWIANKKWLNFIVPIVVGFGVGVGAGMARSLHHTSLNQCSINAEDGVYFSLTDYNRIEVKDTLEKVELILGVGVEKSRSSSQSIYIWVNPNKPSIQGTFSKDGVLQKKELVDVPLKGCIVKLPG